MAGPLAPLEVSYPTEPRRAGFPDCGDRARLWRRPSRKASGCRRHVRQAARGDRSRDRPRHSRGRIPGRLRDRGPPGRRGVLEGIRPPGLGEGCRTRGSGRVDLRPRVAHEGRRHDDRDHDPVRRGPHRARRARRRVPARVHRRLEGLDHHPPAAHAPLGAAREPRPLEARHQPAGSETRRHRRRAPVPAGRLLRLLRPRHGAARHGRRERQRRRASTGFSRTASSGRSA